MTEQAVVKVAKDRRPKGSAWVSETARLLVFQLEARGYRFELLDDRIRIHHGASSGIEGTELEALRVFYHEIRDYLRGQEQEKVQ